MNRAFGVRKFLPSLAAFAFFAVSGFTLAAWTAPTGPGPAPSNNSIAPINMSSFPQSKGGTLIPKGSLLDISGGLSANFLFSWNDATFNGDVSIGGLSGEGVRPVCVGNDHKLYICGAMCGNGIIETGEQCDDGNTDNGDQCSNQCIVQEMGLELGGTCGYFMQPEYASFRNAKFTLYQGPNPSTGIPVSAPRDIRIDFKYWVYDISTLQSEGPIGPDDKNFVSGPSTQTFEISNFNKEITNLSITGLTPAFINGQAICPGRF